VEAIIDSVLTLILLATIEIARSEFAKGNKEREGIKSPNKIKAKGDIIITKKINVSKIL